MGQGFLESGANLAIVDLNGRFPYFPLQEITKKKERHILIYKKKNRSRA